MSITVDPTNAFNKTQPVMLIKFLTKTEQSNNK